MSLRLTISILTAALLLTIAPLAAQKAEFGSAAEAKAMLEKAVAALKADKAKALAMFNKGEGGFKDRDLYVACAGADGKVSAHIDPTRIGMDRGAMKDVTGKPFGQEMAKAKEGEFLEVSYMFPRPGADKTPVQKIAYATKVGDQICIVGYYK